jgi:hypothetical protein
MGEITIKIMPGGSVFFLYSDDHPARGLGKIELKRASNVLWDQMAQRWFIYMPSGNLIGKLDGYESRIAAISDEVKILNELLKYPGATPEEMGFQNG